MALLGLLASIVKIVKALAWGPNPVFAYVERLPDEGPSPSIGQDGELLFDDVDAYEDYVDNWQAELIAEEGPDVLLRVRVSPRGLRNNVAKIKILSLESKEMQERES